MKSCRRHTPEPVLVTGGTGLIGRRLVEALVERGERVRVLGRRPVVRWRGNDEIEYIRADIAEPDVVERAVEGVGRIFHLAATTGGDVGIYDRVTVEGSRRLLEAVRLQNGGRVIFVSSLSVYSGEGMTDGAVVDEQFPLEHRFQTRGAYATSKTKADIIAQEYFDDTSVGLTIVRPGLVYGSGMRHPLNGLAIPFTGRAWLTLGVRHRELPLIHIRDLVNALLQIEISPQSIGQVYNLVGSHCPMGYEYINWYRELSHDRRPFVDVPVRSLLPLVAAADIASRLLGRPSEMYAGASRISRKVHFCGKKVREHLGISLQTEYADALREICEPFI